MKTPYVITIMVGSAGSDVGVLPEPTGDVEAVTVVSEATSALLAYLSRRLVPPGPYAPQETAKELWDRAIAKGCHQ